MRTVIGGMMLLAMVLVANVVKAKQIKAHTYIVVSRTLPELLKPIQGKEGQCYKERLPRNQTPNVIIKPPKTGKAIPRPIKLYWIVNTDHFLRDYGTPNCRIYVRIPQPKETK